MYKYSRPQLQIAVKDGSCCSVPALVRTHRESLPSANRTFTANFKQRSPFHCTARSKASQSKAQSRYVFLKTKPKRWKKFFSFCWLLCLWLLGQDLILHAVLTVTYFLWFEVNYKVEKNDTIVKSKIKYTAGHAYGSTELYSLCLSGPGKIHSSSSFSLY